MEIRALAEDDDRAPFRSGDADLDRFFRLFAGQNQFRHFIGRTYVAVEGVRVLGFVTLSPGHIELERLPAGSRRGLPRHPLPILRLARLAVAEGAQGQGIGSRLLRFALRLAVRMSVEFGCVGVLVDAKPTAVAFYAKYGFERIEALEGGSETRPAPTLMFLPKAGIGADAPP